MNKWSKKNSLSLLNKASFGKEYKGYRSILMLPLAYFCQ